MKDLSSGLPASVKESLTAALPLLIVVILFISLGNFGISRVNALRDQVQIAQTDQSTLNEKLNLLQALSPMAATGMNSAIAALPDSNPSLIATTQLKIAAGSNGVLLSAIRSVGGADDGTGLIGTAITFTVDGGRAQVISFLNSTTQLAPMIVIDNVTSSETLGSVKADVKARSFWAPLPVKIPSVTQPITDLTATEKATLTKVTGLTQPAFIEVTPTVGNNPSPFGQ